MKPELRIEDQQFHCIASRFADNPASDRSTEVDTPISTGQGTCSAPAQELLGLPGGSDGSSSMLRSDVKYTSGRNNLLVLSICTIRQKSRVQRDWTV